MATNHVGKPPHFDGTNCDYWKKRMCLHLKAMSRKIWGVVEETFIVLDMKDPTTREEKFQLNDQTFSVIYEALDPKVFESIKDLEFTHEVWKILEDPYEGTSVVKEAKLYIFKDKYAKFKMLEDKSMSEMFHRLNVIVNEVRIGHKVNDEDFSHMFLILEMRHTKVGYRIKKLELNALGPLNL
jgi:hypothetical protein